jgi:hypothetical protein
LVAWNVLEEKGLIALWWGFTDSVGDFGDFQVRGNRLANSHQLLAPFQESDKIA